MSGNIKIRGKYSYKNYRCTECFHIKTSGTNHWGFTYPFCRECRKITVHECLEPVPPGYGIPEKWKTVKLGDICTVR
jgi:hypothetical protein